MVVQLHNKYTTPKTECYGYYARYIVKFAMLIVQFYFRVNTIFWTSKKSIHLVMSVAITIIEQLHRNNSVTDCVDFKLNIVYEN